ncbi:MAG: ERV1/ALR-related protein [Verrucomicrobiaceae bacterium]|nr:ERV1/ALR-related protein [Verrucomicrobiaceae bacterium]
MNEVLGRILWDTLHSFCAAYPDRPTDDTETMATMFFLNFRDKLMHLSGSNCPCRTVFRKLIQIHPPPLKAHGGALYTWSVALHDFVNLKLGKPLHAPGLEHPILSERTWRAIFGPGAPIPDAIKGA